MLRATKKIPPLLLIVLLFVKGTALGIIIHDDLLRIHASILPKTALMDYDFRDKLRHGNIEVTVLYSPKDLYYAWRFKHYVDKKYSEGINGIMVKVTLVPYNNFNSIKPEGTIFYLMPALPDTLKAAIRHIGPGWLVFSYNASALRLGAHVSLKLKLKVRPILNLVALKASGITLRPAIINISDIFHTVPTQ